MACSQGQRSVHCGHEGSHGLWVWRCWSKAWLKSCQLGSTKALTSSIESCAPGRTFLMCCMLLLQMTGLL